MSKRNTEMSDINIVQGIHDRKIFRSLFKDLSSWTAWLVCLKSIFALSMSPEELKVYRKHTGRKQPPSVPFKEIFLVIGRRGGKSFVSALIAVYLAVFKDWSDCLAVGEKAYIMCLATDRLQAGVIFGYIRGILELPILQGFVINETKDEIQLKNNIIISIKTASYRGLRGFSVLAAICDEGAHWRIEGANPSKEILTALRPSLGNIPNSLLLFISTGYAKSGILWEAYRDKFGKDDKEVLVWQSSTRDMNPTYPIDVISKALKEDHSAAMAEYFGKFRADLESYISTEALDAVIIPGRFELPKIEKASYFAFVDPSGGRGDQMVLSICHKEDSGKIIQDAIRIKRPPFNPQECVEEFVETLKEYGISSVTGDRYSAEWNSSAFEKEGITYNNSELSKSDLYIEFLPLVMQGKVELLDNKRQTIELRQLERRTGRGKDVVDHSRGLKDDIANACAGVCVMAVEGESKGAAGIPSVGIHDIWGVERPSVSESFLEFFGGRK